MATSIVTWNINSLRLRIDLVLRFLAEARPDILCLQETKSPVDKLPVAQIEEAGYRLAVAEGFKGYNGVAILTRVDVAPATSLLWCGQKDARHCAVRLGDGTVVHNVYVPAGGDVPDAQENPKFDHKLRFLAEMTTWSKGLQGRHVLVGDLNIAPLEHDVWSHKQLLKVVSHTPVETEAMAALLAAGQWTDVTRADIPEPKKLYSWWSYRARDWRAADKGRRLDHIWVRGGVAWKKGSSRIFKDYRGHEKPSDHVPVLAEILD